MPAEPDIVNKDNYTGKARIFGPYNAPGYRAPEIDIRDLGNRSLQKWAKGQTDKPADQPKPD